MPQIIHSEDYISTKIFKEIKQKLTEENAVIVYPTESGYGLGCILGNKLGANKIRKIRRLEKSHHFSLMVNNLSQIGQYALVDNFQFRILKSTLPGNYTFIFNATKKILSMLHKNKKTIGIRWSKHYQPFQEP